MSDFELHAFHGTSENWNRLIAQIPGAHLLQTWEWANIKASFGWQPLPLTWSRSQTSADGTASESLPGKPVAAAMVLKRQVLRGALARRLCILYVPKGPHLQWNEQNLRRQVLDDLQALARRHRAILIKIDPDVELGRGATASEADSAHLDGHGLSQELGRRSWRFSSDQIQFRNTVLVDLNLPEEALLQRMKPKTRYNVRLAQRKGVTTRPAVRAEVPQLYRMYAETSQRDGFVIRKQEYYQRVWETFLRPFVDHSQPCAEALVAEVEGEPVAAIFLFYYARRAYYLYGMSRAAHREKMPNHLLQWEAIRAARRQGCLTYDLWGAPDRFAEDDPLWGVYRFKEGLGGEVVRTVGAWDFPASGFWYPLYTRILPRILSLSRARGRRTVRRALSNAQ